VEWFKVKAPSSSKKKEKNWDSQGEKKKSILFLFL
jgi:hypothetical protein